MMGVLPFSRFLTWILTKSISVIFISCLLSAILKGSQTLFKSDGLIIFFLFLTFGLSNLSLSYLIASLHSRASIAALTGCFIYILSFFPYMALTSINIKVPMWLESISVGPLLHWYLSHTSCQSIHLLLASRLIGFFILTFGKKFRLQANYISKDVQFLYQWLEITPRR